MRHLSLLLAVAAAALATTTAPAATEPELKIVFPEGWSAGQMADRAAEVRQIAIRKRGVTPQLSGSTYAAATRAAKAPASFRPFLKRRSVEGFLFPSTYFFEPSSSAASPRRTADRDVPAALGFDRPSRREGPQADAVRRPDHRLADREGDRRAQRARPRCRGDLQPARARHAAGDRRFPPLRPRRAGHATAQAVAPPEQHAVQHAPLQGPAADADHESRPALDARGREARESTTSTTSASRTACATSSRPTSRSSARRPWSTATAAVNAARLRGAARRRPPFRGRCAPLRRPCLAGRRPAPPSQSVRTPNATGTPVSSAASWSPDAASPATKSKCGVSPRITQPSATMHA